MGNSYEISFYGERLVKTQKYSVMDNSFFWREVRSKAEPPPTKSPAESTKLVMILLFSIILPHHPNAVFLKLEDSHIKMNKKDDYYLIAVLNRVLVMSEYLYPEILYIFAH